MTHAEMLAEIAKAMAKTPAKAGPVGVTANEYAAVRKLSIRRARDELRLLQSLGKVDYVGRALRLAMDGQMRAVPVYAPTKGK